ncbi:MAG: hypothetical protein HN348_03380 [Proteobacteria bacterium]|jgi:CysZ protein|nr:hypothetical protein [Pseudomonadota bacterium]
MSDLVEGNHLQLFWRGFLYPFRGFAFLRQHPVLLPWVILPTLMTAAMIIIAAWATFTYTPVLLAALMAPPAGGILLTLWTAIAIVLGIAIFVALAAFLYLLSGIIGAPFYDRLSERVEEVRFGPRLAEYTWWIFAVDIYYSVVHTALALAMWIAIMMLLMGLNVIPVIGSTLEIIGSTMAMALFLAREMMDGAMSRRRLSFIHKVRIVKQHGSLMGGMGLASAMFLAIPVFNLIGMPISIIGGTLLFCDLEEGKLLPGPSDEEEYKTLPRESSTPAYIVANASIPPKVPRRLKQPERESPGLPAKRPLLPREPQ